MEEEWRKTEEYIWNTKEWNKGLLINLGGMDEDGGG